MNVDIPVRRVRTLHVRWEQQVTQYRAPDMPPFVEDTLSSGASCLFLSPHLDDAVLSCGALMQTLVCSCPLTVATIFTAASPKPHTIAARSFLRQCGAVDAATLYATRRAEDRSVLDALGVRHVHLGLVDAVFRRRDIRSATVDRLGRVLPELVHRYPTYRFDVARGRIAPGDRTLIEGLCDEVAELVRRTTARLLFAPIGVGSHVDHLIARTVAMRCSAQVVYYADFPYNCRLAPDPAFVAGNRLVPWSWEGGIASKRHLIRGYRTQAAMFPDGRIPAIPETFYLPSRDHHPAPRPPGHDSVRR